jgi:carbon monoxide dehydrogenase subunit G
LAAERAVVASTTVPAPPEKVFELISDTTRYAEWAENTLEVVRTDGPARTGSTYDERNVVFGPVKSSSRWTVVEHEPPRRSVHRGEGIALAKSANIEFDLVPAGESTELTLTFRYEPAFGPIGAAIDTLLARRSLEASIRRSLDNLAAIAEREAVSARA